MSIPVGIAPRITDENRTFWEQASKGRLVVESCRACGQLVFPPCGVCRGCGGRQMDEHEVTGPGVVYSYTINHQRWMPAMDVPYGLALVDFPDAPGVRILGWVDGEDLNGLHVGATVGYTLVLSSSGLHVPAFRPVRS